MASTAASSEYVVSYKHGMFYPSTLLSNNGLIRSSYTNYKSCFHQLFSVAKEYKFLVHSKSQQILVKKIGENRTRRFVVGSDKLVKRFFLFFEIVCITFLAQKKTLYLFSAWFKLLFLLKGFFFPYENRISDDFKEFMK